jgi:hypothetical protein
LGSSCPSVVFVGVLPFDLVFDDELLVLGRDGTGVSVEVGVIVGEDFGVLDGEVLAVGDVAFGAVAALAGLVVGVGRRHSLLLLLLATLVVLLVQPDCAALRQLLQVL